MMRNLPFRVNYRAFPNFDDAVTCREPSSAASMNQIDMSPLIAMVVNVIGNLAQQDAFIHQNAMSFGHECRIRVCEAVAMLLWRATAQSEPDIEIFGLVTPLVRDMRRIVNNDIECV